MERENELNPVIIGCGYLGRTLSQLLIDRDHISPIGVVKTRPSYERMLDIGAHALLCDLDQAGSGKIDTTGRDVYYFAPPDSVDEADHRVDRFLQSCSLNSPRRLLYISTSGVYGDCDGEWVNESRALAPITTRAKRRVYAEQAVIHFCQQFNCDYMILRVGGIYGAERLPISRLKDIKVICPQEAPFSNRIHIGDLANICHSAMQSELKNEIFNVADGHPTSMTDYFYRIADLAGLPRPECVPMSQAKETLSPGMYSFVNESRRLLIDKMQSQLQVTLQFPTLKLGLEDCFKKLPAK